MKNVLLSDDIFYTMLLYHKFILELHLKDYTRITKQIAMTTKNSHYQTRNVVKHAERWLRDRL